MPTKPYIPSKKTQGKNLNLHNQIIDFDLDIFQQQEEEEESEATLMEFLFNCTDLQQETSSDQGNHHFQQLIHHFDTFVVKPSAKISERRY